MDHEQSRDRTEGMVQEQDRNLMGDATREQGRDRVVDAALNGVIGTPSITVTTRLLIPQNIRQHVPSVFGVRAGDGIANGWYYEGFGRVVLLFPLLKKGGPSGTHFQMKGCGI